MATFSWIPYCETLSFVTSTPKGDGAKLNPAGYDNVGEAISLSFAREANMYPKKLALDERNYLIAFHLVHMFFEKISFPI